MDVRGLVAGLCVALACAGCTPDDDTAPDASPSTSSSPSATSAAPEPKPTPGQTSRTTELRYRVQPRDEAVLSVRLPPQKPGGTMVTWSAYLVGVGKGASADYPRKVECYVVQADGPAFEDRVLYVADDSTLSAGTDVSMSGSGLVDTKDGRRLSFECELDDSDPATIPGLGWHTIPQQPIQVTLTPVRYERRSVAVK